MALTLLLIDDEAIVRQGLRMRLNREPGITIVGEASTGAQALQQAQLLQPDVILMDFKLPDTDGIAVTSTLQAPHRTCAVIILSLQDDGATRARALAAGAVAFVGKHEGVQAILTVLRQMEHCKNDCHE